MWYCVIDQYVLVIRKVIRKTVRRDRRRSARQHYAAWVTARTDWIAGFPLRCAKADPSLPDTTQIISAQTCSLR